MFDSKTELAPLGGAFSPNGLAQMSGSAQRQTGREIERVQAQALVADVKEQGRGAAHQHGAAERRGPVRPRGAPDPGRPAG